MLERLEAAAVFSDTMKLQIEQKAEGGMRMNASGILMLH